MKHRISQVDGNNDSDEENSEDTKVVEEAIPCVSSGVIVVFNWDKEENREVHLLHEVLLEPPSKVFCQDRVIGFYEVKCKDGVSFLYKFADGTIDKF